VKACNLEQIGKDSVYSYKNSIKQNDLLIKHSSNMPIIAITGTNGKTTTTRLIAYTISKAGFKVGMTTTDGIYINGECVLEGDTTGPYSANIVLTNNEVDIAVLETARGGIIRGGLAYELADVAVITNITDDHLGLNGIETLEDLADIKALVGEAVKTDGYVVINGDDFMSRSILNRFKSKLIVFSAHKDNEILDDNIKNGGYGIYIDEGNLCIQNKDMIIPLINIHDIGITIKGALKYNIQNAMAACGALIAFGIDSTIIKKALKDFQCNEELNPGRFNVFDIDGVITILDYGHNIDGYKSVLEGLAKIKHNNLIGVIGVPGDRLDRTTLQVGKISGSYFNKIFIKEDKDRRGRLPKEVAELLKKGVLDSGFSSNDVKIVLDESEALTEALDAANTGDIVIIFFDDYASILSLVKDRITKISKESLNLTMV
jgi:cyanophycin synthetase